MFKELWFGLASSLLRVSASQLGESEQYNRWTKGNNVYLYRASHVYSVQLMFLWMVLEDHKVLCVIKINGWGSSKTNRCLLVVKCYQNQKSLRTLTQSCKYNVTV